MTHWPGWRTVSPRCPGVLQAQVRPNTGSDIVENHSPVADVLEEAATRVFARIREKPQAPPVNQVLQMGLMQADQGLKDKTGNALDLRTAIALALIGGRSCSLAAVGSPDRRRRWHWARCRLSTGPRNGAEPASG